MVGPKLLVYGAGSVGTFIGMLLADEYDVTLLGRQDRLGVSGQAEFSLIRLSGEKQTAELSVCNKIEDLDSSWRPDGIIITTKAFALDAALKDIKTRHREWDRPWVCLFQNGIGAEEMGMQMIGQSRLLSGTLTASVSLQGRTVVQNSRGGVALAAVNPDRGRECRLLAQGFAQHKILCRCLADYRAMKWSKLLLNQIANGICALTDKTPAQVIADTELFGLEVESARETLAVMEQMEIEKVNLPAYPVRLAGRLLKMLPITVLQRTVGRKIARSRGDKLPSLLLEVRTGRRAREAEFMYGAVARSGQDCGVATPVNETIAVLLEEGRYPVTTDQLIKAVGNAR